MAKNGKPPKVGNPKDPAEAGNHEPEPVSSQELDEFVTHLLGSHGTPLAALKKVAGEQLRYRKRAQAAEKNAEELRELVPDKDSVILKGEEAKAYGTLKGKSITLDKVPAMLDSLEKLETSVKTTTRGKDLDDAAGTKFDRDMLARLLGETPLEFQNVNERDPEDEKKIKVVRVPYVLIKDGDKTVKEALDSYADREFAKFKDLLVLDESAEPEVKESKTTTKKTESTGARMPRQSSVPAVTSKVKGKETLAAVDKVTSSFVTPSQRRKEASGAA